MAKSKTRTSSAAVAEKKPTNPLANQFYSFRSEVRKVTWPTRDEARSLTIAVTVITIVIAIFLFLIDLLFEGVVAGVASVNITWIITGVVLLALLSAAFYFNGSED